jgi:DNA repair protein RadC
MAIKNWFCEERPREKLLIKGAAALSDAELLAILLRIGKKGKTAVDLARELLMEFGGLRCLLDAEKKAVCQYSGIGIAKYTQIHAALELAKRHLLQTLKYKDVLNDSTATKQYLTANLRHRKQEVFAAIFLNRHNQVIGYEELFFGTIDSSAVHPREIVKKALSYNAAGIIFAHNHPSGISTPSSADKQLTTHLAKALYLVDTKVLDHIIIGEGDTFSFAEKNLVPVIFE